MARQIIQRSSRCLLGLCILISAAQLTGVIGVEEKDFPAKVSLTKSFPVQTPVSSAKIAANDTTLFEVPFKVDKEDIYVETLRFMDSLMDRKAKPCENFYQYACGNWKNSARVPTESQKTIFNKAILHKMEKFLIEQMKNATANMDTMKTSKRFFSACVKDFNNLKSGIDSLLAEEQGVYDKVKNLNGTKWILLNFMSPYNVFPLLPFKIHYCLIDRRSQIMIKVPEPKLQKKLNDKEFMKFFDGKSTELATMLDFEKNLTASVNASEVNEFTTVGKFLRNHAKDTINWAEVFAVAFHGKVQATWPISNRIENFVNIERVLRRTDPEVLRNYVKWSTVLHFYRIWTEKSEQDPTFERICLRQTEKYFSGNLLPLMINNLYNEMRREDMLLMTSYLHTEFENIIEHSTFGDKRTKVNAQKIIRALDYLVGYTEEMLLNEKSPYADENITTNYFKNLQTVEMYRASKDLQNVGLTVKDAIYKPYSVNAYYMTAIHKISIPIGVSQMPLYHISFPNSLKYAGLGFMIAHEIAHSLDIKMKDTGKNVWYTENSKEDFWERYQCFVDEYKEFIFQGLSMNISATIYDNIADNVAGRIAYQTYMQHTRHVSGYNVPILNMTNPQVFFLKLAQSWCTGHDDIYKANQMLEADHTYPDFRVKGLLRNMPEFSEAFGCRLGTEMNPLKKCKIW